MRIAIERSGVEIDDIVHVNAHGTSTPVGDMGEANAVADILGEDTVVTSTKSMTGHLLGAAGAIESVATVLSVHHDVVPPTINLENPDDGLRVDVPREARKMPIPAAMNDSFGFGGHNVSLIFRKA
jgi:3-oxoacyl-[acyl-carrier-protein] synthase II